MNPSLPYGNRTTLFHREEKDTLTRHIAPHTVWSGRSFVNWSLCWNMENVAQAMNFKIGYVTRPEANLTEFIQIPIVLAF